MKKTTFTLILSVLFVKSALIAQIVNIPDANFKACLLADIAINTNADSEIQVSEAIAFTGSINCGGLNISNLIGLEAFTNVTYLGCENNQLSTIDITANLALDGLTCSNNQLTSIYIAPNGVLFGLDCSNNLLTSLDISNITTLTELWCENNLLTSLNIANGNNTNFGWLKTANNPYLSCINVDDSIWSSTSSNWDTTVISPFNTPYFSFDNTSYFSENCSIFNNLFDVLEKDNNIKLFPNPTDKSITLDFGKTYTDLKIEVSNIVGQNIKTLLVKNSNQIYIELGESKGIYFVKIFANNSHLNTFKVLKE